MSAFQIELRREPGYELRVNIRFQVKTGLGVLALPGRGRADTAPIQVGDEHDISADVLRAGRFVHHVSDKRREAYSFSRLTQDLLARVPDDRFVRLEATTEFGFRYIVLAEELPPPAMVASIRMPPSGTTPVSMPRVKRPKGVSHGEARSLLERTRGRGENTPPDGTPKISVPPQVQAKLSELVSTPVAPASAPEVAASTPAEDSDQGAGEANSGERAKPPLFQEPSPMLTPGLALGQQLAMPSTPLSATPAPLSRGLPSSGALPPPPVAAAAQPSTWEGSPAGSVDGDVARVSSRVPSHPPSAPKAPAPAPSSGELTALLERHVEENARLKERIARLERHLAERARREEELLTLLTSWQTRLPEI